ncbi:MAG TPA: tetratricopeptide repeat protein [Xanthobacteraceae bacterium]|nr:tetratricopeptide repeat protein [Xanthobacteraceae bacterium]
MTVSAVSVPAAAQSLSEQLAQRIEQAREAERSRNFDTALQIYERTIRQDGLTPTATRTLLKNRSQLFEVILMFDRAEADLTEAFKVTPDDATAYADRGYFYMRRGRYDDALDDFVAGARLDPRNPIYMFGAARSLVAKGDFAAAVAFYTEAIKNGPNDGKLYLARAEALVRLKRWDDARADYNRSIKLGLPSPVERYYAFAGRGYVALASTDYHDAVANFDEALAINPDAFNVLSWRGYAHERRGNALAALRDYERAAQISPDDDKARDGTRRMRIAARSRGEMQIGR